jgi:hypothetical protein
MRKTDAVKRGEKKGVDNHRKHGKVVCNDP